MHQVTVRRTLSRGFGGGRTIPLRLPRPPFSFVPSTARFLFGGTKRKCGVGTVGSKSCHAHADKGRGNIRLKYAKRIPALRLVHFCRTLRCGTFPRRKVPKGRQEGCFESSLLQLHLGLRAVASDGWPRNAPAGTASRLLKRRRAGYSVHFGKQSVKQIVFSS